MEFSGQRRDVEQQRDALQVERDAIDKLASYLAGQVQALDGRGVKKRRCDGGREGKGKNDEYGGMTEEGW